ncbi:MAG TPA: hypothetical protein VF766_16080 [Pyrinomonadaceae bacterium]
MKDSGSVLFGIFLLLVGLALVAFVRSELVHRQRPGGANQAIRQQAARALRQMERQRGRVWWKMDEAYAEFVKKSAIESSPAKLLPERVTPPSNTGELTIPGEEDFALTELQTAYEVFLRKDSHLTTHANYAPTDGKSFGTTAG